MGRLRGVFTLWEAVVLLCGRACQASLCARRTLSLPRARVRCGNRRLHTNSLNGKITTVVFLSFSVVVVVVVVVVVALIGFYDLRDVFLLCFYFIFTFGHYLKHETIEGKILQANFV